MVFLVPLKFLGQDLLRSRQSTRSRNLISVLDVTSLVILIFLLRICFWRGFFLVVIFPFAALLAMMGRADKPNKDLELVDGEFSLLGAFLYNVVSFFPSAFLFLFFLFACTTLQHLAGHRKSPTVSCI